MRRAIRKVHFTDSDWESAEPIDKIYMHLMEPEAWPLTDALSQRLADLRIVWTAMTEYRTRKDQVKHIAEQIEVSERTVFRYMDDACFLFGDLLAVNTLIELQLMYQRLLSLGKKAEDDDDYDTARRCEADARDVLLQIEQRMPADEVKYLGVLFTDDPRALQQENDHEYTQYEESTAAPEGVLELEAIGVPAHG